MAASAGSCDTSGGGGGITGKVITNGTNSFVPSLPPFPTTEELELCRTTHNNSVSDDN